jgi:hypothetical protein
MALVKLSRFETGSGWADLDDAPGNRLVVMVQTLLRTLDGGGEAVTATTITGNTGSGYVFALSTAAP